MTITEPAMVCGSHASWEPSAGVHGRGEIHATIPDVHHVPVGDLIDHTVPGAAGDLTDQAGGRWAAVTADPAAPNVQCDCWPTVRATRDGGLVGRVIGHIPQDGREEPT